MKLPITNEQIRQLELKTPNDLIPMIRIMQVEAHITLLKIRFGGSAVISMINVDTLVVGEFIRRLHPTMIIVSPQVVIPEEIVEIATSESIAIRWMP